MKKRIKLQDRALPDYSRGEEVMNMVTHIVGGGLAILMAALCVLRALGAPLLVIGCGIYGGSMLCVYTFSSVYHGLYPGTGKKVMQIIDHCGIYFLIAGTYTPILLGAFLSTYPVIAIGLLVMEWGLCFLAATLTAIDLEKYEVFSMICYILMGWAIIFFVEQTRQVLGAAGFGWLLAGGIAYTVGAVLYGIGSKKRWMHSVFHIFVVLGSVLQFVAIFGWGLP